MTDDEQTERFALMLATIQQAFDAILAWAPTATEREIQIYEKMTDGLADLIEAPWTQTGTLRN